MCWGQVEVLAAPPVRSLSSGSTSQVNTTKSPVVSKKPVSKVWRTRVPFAASLLGGLVFVATGFTLQAVALKDVGAALVAGGLSVFLIAPASLLWWNPTGTNAVFGVILAGASMIGGIILAAGAIPSMNSAYGWGLLGAFVLHLLVLAPGIQNLGRERTETKDLRRKLRFQKREPSRRLLFQAAF